MPHSKAFLLITTKTFTALTIAVFVIVICTTQPFVIAQNIAQPTDVSSETIDNTEKTSMISQDGLDDAPDDAEGVPTQQEGIPLETTSLLDATDSHQGVEESAQDITLAAESPVEASDSDEKEFPETAVEDVVTEIIVTYDTTKKLTTDLNDAEDDLRAEITILEKIDDANIALIQVIQKSTDDTKSSAELTKKIAKQQSITLAEENLKRTGAFVPNDNSFSKQWAHVNTGQKINGTRGTAGADIDSDLAWNNESTDTSPIIVAVIDTGVDYTNPEIAANMWDGSAGCVDDLGNAISGGCPHHGWNYENNNNDPNDTGHTDPTYTGHGTFAASQLAAVTNNGSDIAGTSRYNNIDIMALRFNFDVFSGIKAINFAKNNGAKVINASFGGAGYSQIEADAIAAFPGVFVTAAGNGGADSVGDNVDTAGFYPCSYTQTNIICVAATNQDDELASFSNYGTTNVDIAAPGVNLFGLYRGEYLYGNGTSFASPLVAGAVALLYKKTPTATASTIVSSTLLYADSVTKLNGKVANNRRLNVAKAIQGVTEEPDAGPNMQYAYRFWSTAYNGHFYTTSVAEKNSIIINYPLSVWNLEGIVFKTYSSAISPDIKPVYRFWSDLYNGHFYTISENEKNAVIANDPNWNYENIAYYAQIASNGTNQPLYRFWSPTYRHHFYTISEDEKNAVIANNPNWSYEGIAYYLPK